MAVSIPPLLDSFLNSVDAPIFYGLIEPLFLVVYFFDTKRLPTSIAQLLATIVGIGSLFIGQKTDNFFKPNVRLTSPYQIRSSYEFIVVGGGITGCLMAKRLSDAGHTTLLIHGPGTVPNMLDRVPLLNFGNQGNPDHDFTYAGPKLNSRWENHTLHYNSGKDFGGSQVLSAQMWSYGKSGDFKCWREQFGISDKFSQKTIREHGRLHENASSQIKGTDYPYGDSGEIKLSYSPTWEPYRSKIETVFERTAARVTGTQVNADQNSDALGFGKIIHAVEDDTGYISTPVRAFFEGGFSKNLDIVTRSMVTKVLFDTPSPDSLPRATGVEFKPVFDIAGLVKLNATATKRVILTAGAIRTPQLMILSGVGPEAEVKKWGISQVAINDGVGQNLHDHYDIGNAAVCFPNNVRGYPDFSAKQLVQFILDRRGQLRAPLGTQAYGFFASKQRNLTTCPDPKDHENCRPDFEMILQSIGQNIQAVAKHYYSIRISNRNLQRDYFLQGRDRSIPRNSFDVNLGQAQCLMMTPTLLHPEYRGQVTLTSSDPLDQPIVDLKTTSNSRDMILIGELWQMVKKIINESFEGLKGRFDDTAFAECEHIQDRDSNEFGSCQVQRYMKSAWHMGGSCRLGRVNDTLACVDESFHVIGVQNLMVADASVVPCPTSGHMLPLISALAEMAAKEAIKENTSP